MFWQGIKASLGIGHSQTTFLDNCLLKRQNIQPYAGAHISSLHCDSVWTGSCNLRARCKQGGVALYKTTVPCLPHLCLQLQSLSSKTVLKLEVAQSKATEMIRKCGLTSRKELLSLHEGWQRQGVREVSEMTGLEKVNGKRLFNIPSKTSWEAASGTRRFQVQNEEEEQISHIIHLILEVLTGCASLRLFYI